MSNPFSLLEELSAPKTTQSKKKPQKKKAKKAQVKKNTTVDNKQPHATQNVSQKRKPKRVFLHQEDESNKTQSTAPAEKKEATFENRSFDGPATLKNYKRDGNKAYGNRRPGSSGKRYDNRDRHVNRTGHKFQRNGVKNGEGGSYNWKGRMDLAGKPTRYARKRPQEMNDEEWENQLKADAQKQKKEEQRSKKGKKDNKKKSAVTTTTGNKDSSKDGEVDNKNNKNNNKKGKPKKKKDNNRKKEREEEKEDVAVVEPEEDESDDEGKETYEDFLKNRKKPVTLNEGASRKAREGVKIQAKQLEFTRGLSNKNGSYMKVSKKKKKTEKDASPKTPTSAGGNKKKSKKKVLSNFFDQEASTTKKSSNTGSKGARKGSSNKNRKGKKNAPDFKDRQSFPSLG